MKKPSPVAAPPFNDEQLFDLVREMDLPHLETLISFANEIRDKVREQARKDFYARYRAEAQSLGIEFEAVAKPANPLKGRKHPPAAPMPSDWRDRVVKCLEANDGRATAKVIHSAVWPEGGAGAGSGGRLRSYLLKLVDNGVLVLIRPGGDGVQALYGLASMIDMSEPDAA